jgi:wyosine [tRNA(Phe)-imidazoG37] synthetase (radical SAM superfamily)
MKSAGNLPDTITFAGNGEPTLHPHFKGIIEDTVVLRNQIASGAKITVLSNATMVHLKDVFEALKLADNNVLKLDAGTEEMYRLINRGPQKLPLEQIVENLMKFAGKLTVQTLFLKGKVDGILIDNTTESEVHAWLGHLQRIKPELLMIYPIARATPASGLEKIEKKILQKIAYQAEGLGIKTEVF